MNFSTQKKTKNTLAYLTMAFTKPCLLGSEVIVCIPKILLVRIFLTDKENKTGHHLHPSPTKDQKPSCPNLIFWGDYQIDTNGISVILTFQETWTFWDVHFLDSELPFGRMENAPYIPMNGDRACHVTLPYIPRHT